MIRFYVLIFSFVCLTSGAFAQTETATTAEVPAEPVTEFSNKVLFKVGAGIQARIEKQPGSVESTETFASPSVFSEVEYRQYQLHTEFEQVQRHSSEGAYSIRTKRNELLLIGRYRFFLDERWALFAGLGGGLAKETVNTTYGSSSTTNTGDTEKLIAFEGGAQFQFHQTYFAEVSGRGLKLENLQPVVMTFGLRLGARL